MATGQPCLRWFVVLAVATLLAGTAVAERAVHVYRVQHRTAEDLQPFVATVLAGRGEVAVDGATNSLVLIGDAEAVREALSLLAIQDRALRMILLRHRTERVQALAASGIHVDWSLGGSRARIGNVRRPGARSGMALGGGEVQRGGHSDFEGTVRILEGSTGRIGSGRSVPVQTRGRWFDRTTLVSAESGFEATPRILGDGRVRVDLAPVQANVDRHGNVRFARAVTTVVVTPGETVAVGGLGGSSTTRSSGSGLHAGVAQDERVLLLTVEIEDPTR